MIVVAARAAAPRPTHQAGVVKRCLVPAFDGRYLAYIIWPHFTILFDSNVRIATHLWAFGLTVLTAMATTITSNAIPMTPLEHAVHQQTPPSNTPNHSATPNQAHVTNVPPSSTHNATVASAQTTTRQVVPAALPTTGSTPVSTKKKSYSIRWSPVNKCITLILALLALIVTLYYAIMSGPGSLADRRAIWSSHNDFRATCISELESELSRSPACDKVLAQPAEPPPDLERMRRWVEFSFPVEAIVLAYVLKTVASALSNMATRVFGRLQLTTVTWETFDVKDRNKLGGISRTFERFPATLTPPSDILTRVRQIFTSPDHAHEYRLSSSRVLMAHMPVDLTENEGVRVVHWKELCHLSKTLGLHTIEVPLLSADDTQSLSLNQRNLKQRARYFTHAHADLRSESEYPTIHLPYDDTKESGCAGLCREHLDVLMNSALLEHGAGPKPAKFSFDYDSLGGLEARGYAKASFGDRINMPDIFERNTYKHDED
jgi:hypothetical protein